MNFKIYMNKWEMDGCKKNYYNLFIGVRLLIFIWNFIRRIKGNKSIWLWVVIFIYDLFVLNDLDNCLVNYLFFLLIIYFKLY